MPDRTALLDLREPDDAEGVAAVPDMDFVQLQTFLREQQQRLVEVARANPSIDTREAFLQEVTAVARLAVGHGKFRDAAPLYKLLGETNRLTGPEQHLHLHGPTTPAGGRIDALTDQELYARLERTSAALADPVPRATATPAPALPAGSPAAGPDPHRAAPAPAGAGAP